MSTPEPTKIVLESVIHPTCDDNGHESVAIDAPFYDDVGDLIYAALGQDLLWDYSEIVTVRITVEIINVEDRPPYKRELKTRIQPR